MPATLAHPIHSTPTAKPSEVPACFQSFNGSHDAPLFDLELEFWAFSVVCHVDTSPMITRHLSSGTSCPARSSSPCGSGLPVCPRSTAASRSCSLPQRSAPKCELLQRCRYYLPRAIHLAPNFATSFNSFLETMLSLRVVVPVFQSGACETRCRLASPPCRSSPGPLRRSEALTELTASSPAPSGLVSPSSRHCHREHMRQASLSVQLASSATMKVWPGGEVSRQALCHKSYASVKLAVVQK